MLAGLNEDQYVPFESARIEVSPKISSFSAKGSIDKEMAENIWKNVEADTIYRKDVDFLISEKRIYSFIGSSAHMLFLDSVYIMKILIF